MQICGTLKKANYITEATVFIHLLKIGLRQSNRIDIVIIVWPIEDEFRSPPYSFQSNEWLAIATAFLSDF